MNLIKADFYRMFRSAAFWIVFAFMCVCATAYVWISYAVESGILGFEVISTSSLLMDTMMVTIIGPVLSAIFVCSDFQNKTIQASILYGKGRKAIVWAKLISYTFMMFFMLLPYAVATFIGFSSGAKFNLLFAKSVDSAYMTILANEANVEINAAMIGKLILVLFIISLVHASRSSLCILLSYWLKSPVAVIGVGIIAELLLSLIAVAAAGSDIITKCISWTPFISMQNNFSLSTNMGNLLKSAGACLVFISIIINLTAGFFRKSEVK